MVTLVLEKLKSIFHREKDKPKEEKKKPKRERAPVISVTSKPVGIVVYRCNVCGFTTGSRAEIRRHVREAHGEEYRFNKQERKWDKESGVYTAEYFEAPRKARFHLSEMYERVLIRR